MVELSRTDELRRGVDIIVVLDGSSDDSARVLASLASLVPFRVVWQENQGLAAARNRIVSEARGDIVLFLDDDMMPSSRLIEHHRQAHETTNHAAVMGPCLYPDGWPVPRAEREHWRCARDAHTVLGRIQSYRDFSAANTSIPRSLLLEVGGFDERFVHYGCEDWELGYRLLRAGHPIRFDAGAVAWHHQLRSLRSSCRLRIEVGQSLAFLVESHPDTIETIPLEDPSLGRQWFCKIGGRSPTFYRSACYMLSMPLTRRLGDSSLGTRLTKWSSTSGTMAGLVIGDHSGRLASRMCGDPVALTTLAARTTHAFLTKLRSRRAKRDPPTGRL
jgi:cellulose synthase/poly-beta-1,6-N-acetylglucosamine synthase-like glycosyltransferase